MQKYEEQKFALPELAGISKKSVDMHLTLYAGYVKNANAILEKISEYGADSEKHAYALGELQRRFAFEFDGMRNHEHYFRAFEGGAAALPAGSELKKAIEKEWGSFDAWLARFKAIGTTRGIGWAILYYDPVAQRLVHTWCDEQHLGHLTGLSWVLGLDMWEHSFIVDHGLDKKKYIEAFFENLNWNVIEDNFKKGMKRIEK